MATTSFICGLKTDITHTALENIYPGEKRLLPSSVSGSDRTNTGLLTTAALDRILARLETDKIVPRAKMTTSQGATIPIDITAHRAAVKALLQGAKNEYCYYHNRYVNALDYLFSGLSTLTDSSATSDQQNDLTNRLQVTSRLNRKLNDLVQIIGRITEKLMNSSSELKDDITRFTRELKDAKEKLEKQNDIIQSNEATMRIKKEMVKYTEEKARYSDNLLKMYSFLNVVALGLLVYVYKAAGDE
jgi:uncharacterized phage infection (PIP) family protein YhgE